MSKRYTGCLVTDLVRIRESGKSMEAENRDFRRYVCAHHHQIEEFQTVALRVQHEIDCTTCGNCCRWGIVEVQDTDIQRIAEHLHMEVEDVRRLYTENGILQSTDAGCVFLDEGLCMIYEARPKTCRDFPHVTQGEHSLGARFSSLCKWASLCPIIYNALEEYKHLLGYHHGKRTDPH